jgi:hypothetical protein
MSSTDPGHNSPYPADYAPQDEALPFGLVAVVATITAVIFAIAVIWTARLMTNVEDEVRAQSGTPRSAVEIPNYGEAEVGIVDQQNFALERRALEMRRAHVERLASYGWVNRAQGTIHIPIDEAMKRYAAQAAQAPAPAPTEGQPSQGGGEPQPQPQNPTP